MKRLKTLFIMAAACVVSAVAQVPEPVIGVSFNSSGPVLSGTDAANHTCGKCVDGGKYTYIMQDSVTKTYIGMTDRVAGGYYWVKYNSTDELGKAFAGDCTWEILFRLCHRQGYTKTSNKDVSDGTTKIFSSQQSGGFSLGNYAGESKGGVKFEYVTDGTVRYLAPGLEKAEISTAEYKHVIVTVDKSTGVMTMYINGEKVGSVEDENVKLAFTYPKIGTTKQKTNMWLCLGADPAGLTEPAEVGTENSNRTSFVFAKVYNTVLTQAQVTERYNNDIVQYFTTYTPTTTSDMLWDVFPRRDGRVTDESPFHEIGIHGTLTTGWNSDKMRYEVRNATSNNNNYAWRDYFDEPDILHALTSGVAIEVYCKSNVANPATTTSPLSFQQASGGIGLEFRNNEYADAENGKTGVIKYNYANYGLNSNTKTAGNMPLNIDSADVFLTTDYTHYVATTDRAGNISKIYINGVEAGSFSQTYEETVGEEIITKEYDLTHSSHSFTYLPYQWFCFNGDTKANRHTTCDFPFDGNIVFGRVWGKYLTADDVTALYNQAEGTSTVVTMQTNKLATAVFPYDAVVPEGATAYVVDVTKGGEANMVPYAAEGDVIPYGTPVIIKGDASTYTFNAADVSNDAVVAKIKPAPAKNLLVGSFATKKAKADQLYAISTTAAKFDKAAADDVLDAQQAWLPFEEGGEDALTLTENIVLNEAEGAASLDGYPEGYTATGKFSRTFKNAVSSTVCLPYAINSVSGGTLYSFDNITESEGEYTVHMSAASLPTTANTPYLFMPSADGEVTFSGMMTVPASVEAGNTTSGDWAFEGTYEKTIWSGLPAGSSAVYGYAAKAQNTINPGDFVKLKMTGEAYTPAFRAVMKYTGGASARSLKGTVPTLPSRLKVVLTDGNGNVTEIGSLEILQEQETWFTIDGKELQAKPTKRGIYIRNGKKVFVK